MNHSSVLAGIPPPLQAIALDAGATACAPGGCGMGMCPAMAGGLGCG